MTDHDHISDLRWDRLLAGELSPEQQAAITAHSTTCTSCAARRREIEAARDAFSTRPPMAFAPRRSRWWLGAPVAALAAAALVVILIRPGTETERTKGHGPALLLAAGRPGALAPIATSDTIHAGDYLQAGYSASRDGFGAVLSLDGAGSASAYVPATGDALVALPAGTDRSFPGSTVLDDVIGTERIAIVWCDAARPLAPLIAELKATQRIANRDGCTIRLVTLEKAR